MKITLKSCLIAALYLGTSLSVGGTNAAHAGTFQRNTTPGEEASVIYEGTIAVGDAAKLERVIASRWRSRRVATTRIFVNLHGGMVNESLAVADVMLKHNIEIVVDKANYCVSACLNLFVAGNPRWFTSKSFIGVHAALTYTAMEKGTAVGKGEETTRSRSATMVMAQIWAEYGVPPAIIVKMLATSGDDITWLSISDLTENGWAREYDY